MVELSISCCRVYFATLDLTRASGYHNYHQKNTSFVRKSLKGKVEPQMIPKSGGHNFEF